MEQKQSWYLSESETALEVVFISLLTCAMGIGPRARRAPRGGLRARDRRPCGIALA